MNVYELLKPFNIDKSVADILAILKHNEDSLDVVSVKNILSNAIECIDLITKDLHYKCSYVSSQDHYWRLINQINANVAQRKILSIAKKIGPSGFPEIEVPEDFNDNRSVSPDEYSDTIKAECIGIENEYTFLEE